MVEGNQSKASPAAFAVAAVRNLAPYVTGKPMSELARELGINDIVKLASNENPLGPSPAALAAMRRSLDELWLYPDGNGHELKAALARRHGVSMSQLTLGNGSNDLLVLLAEAFLTHDVAAVYSQYAFAIYALVVQATGARARVAPAFGAAAAMPYGHDLDAMAAAVDASTRLLFVANPNNPTGSWNRTAEVVRFLDRVPSRVVVVLDEAYFEYSREFGCPDGIELLPRYPNLVVLRTFSKAHALAGLRVGYAVSHPDVADVLNRVRQPFNVNLPALAAAEASLGDPDQAARAVALVTEGRRQFEAELPRMGVKLHLSAGNFVLADVGQDAQQVFERLLRQGVIVRPVGGYGLPQCLRITIGTAAQNERLVSALRTCLQPQASALTGRR